jgi:hypothetical protein
MEGIVGWVERQRNAVTSEARSTHHFDATTKNYISTKKIPPNTLFCQLEFKAKLCLAEQSFALNSNDPRQNRLDSVLTFFS